MLLNYLKGILSSKIKDEFLSNFSKYKFKESNLQTETINNMFKLNDLYDENFFNFNDDSEKAFCSSISKTNFLTEREYPSITKPPQIIISALNSMNNSPNMRKNTPNLDTLNFLNVNRPGRKVSKRCTSATDNEVNFHLKKNKKVYSNTYIDIDINFLKQMNSRTMEELKVNSSLLEDQIINNYQDCMDNFGKKEDGIYSSTREKANSYQALRTDPQQIIFMSQVGEDFEPEYLQPREDVNHLLESDSEELLLSIQNNKKIISVFNNNFCESGENSDEDCGSSDFIEKFKNPKIKNNSMFGEKELKKRLDEFRKTTIFKKGFVIPSIHDLGLEHSGLINYQQPRETALKDPVYKTEELMFETYKELRITDLKNIYSNCQSESEYIPLPENEPQFLKDDIFVSFKKPQKVDFEKELSIPKTGSGYCIQKIEEHMQDTIQILGFNESKSEHDNNIQIVSNKKRSWSEPKVQNKQQKILNKIFSNRKMIIPRNFSKQDVSLSKFLILQEGLSGQLKDLSSRQTESYQSNDMSLNLKKKMSILSDKNSNNNMLKDTLDNLLEINYLNFEMFNAKREETDSKDQDSLSEMNPRGMHLNNHKLLSLSENLI